MAILEVATLDIIPGQEFEFEMALSEAWSLVASMKGFHQLELNKCIENPSRYKLFIWWETLEDHTIGFRESPEYQEWKALLHHFYVPTPTVEHYEYVGGTHDDGFDEEDLDLDAID